MKEEKKSLISAQDIVNGAIEFTIVVLAVIGLIFVIGFISFML